MINFDNLKVGQNYDRNYLAQQWGYKSYQAISRGIVTPKNQNIIILFVTKEKQECLTQYIDDFDEANQILTMEGEDKHTNDNRLINSYKNDDEIYLFYRQKHHSAFKFVGRVYLIAHKIRSNIPSRFLFSVDNDYKDFDNNSKNEYVYLRSVNVDSIAKYSVNKNKKKVVKDLSKSIEIRQERNKRHNEIVKKFAKKLSDENYELYEGRIDCLGIKKDSSAIISEIKTLDGTIEDEYKQIMKAFSQLYYYETFEIEEFPNIHTKKVAVFEKRISDKHIVFLEKNNIKVIWLEGDAFYSSKGIVREV